MADPATDLSFTDYKAQRLAAQLRDHIAGEVRFDMTSRLLYSTDASIYQVRPLGVVIPRTAEDLHTTVQVAAEMRIPITARGAGTSLSGQSIGPGIVIDCSKYLNRILEIDPTARMARVQPGVVLDQLNRALVPHGLQFGPDVATASRANLGGMIGNNSAGARSIVHGKTIDHVRTLQVILADGTRTELGPLAPHEWHQKARAKTLAGAIHRETFHVVRSNLSEIRRRFPRIMRRVSGYNLDVFARNFSPVEDTFTAPVGLHQLLVGSEGTLGVIAEAELNLVPTPRAVGLLVPHFSSLAAALDALAVCLEHHPSAVELLDRLLIELASANLSLRNTMAAIQGRPASLLMVELTGINDYEVSARMDQLRQRLQRLPGVTAVVPALDPALRLPLWNLRSAAMPLVLGLHGARKPVTFIEDAAVAPERLPHFIARFQEILRRHGTAGAFYGHASVGCLHIRPLLNLKDRADIATMRHIMEEVTDLVLAYNGSLSGEHGDGLARSEWNRKMFGDAVYQAFCQIKRTFDPDNLFNPGRIVNAPPMTENLRYGAGYRVAHPLTVFDYSKQEGFTGSVELCNGAGVCRRLQGGTMCPSFRATRDEKDSTRARANALRLALSGAQPLQDLRSRWVHDVLDLCLMCKACKSECPSNVDMAKLKAEFLHFYHRGRPRSPGALGMGWIHRVYQLGALAAPLANWLARKPLVRWLLEHAAGIDRRRSLPLLHAPTFRQWFNQRKTASAGTRGKVLLLDDCFTNYNEPDIGQAAVQVLEAAGYQVELTGLVCCARPMISKGFLPQARDVIQSQAHGLARRLAGASALVGLEPSCLLTLTDEWQELVPSPTTRKIATSAHLLDHWLAEQVAAGQCELRLRPLRDRCIIHGHCHQKALIGSGGTRSVLQMIPQLEVETLNTGCCGMAGSFGYEKNHYDVSVTIANLDLLPALAAQPDALVVAPGTSCRHQIRDLSQRQPLHPLEVLAQQL